MRLFLVVDDEPEIRELLRYQVTDLGYECIVAKDGLDALKFIENREIDAVISDINMPVMNGIQLLTEVRLRGLPLPFIFLTGNTGLEYLTAAMHHQVIDYIEKPFAFAVLEAKIHRILDIGHKKREIQHMLGQLISTESSAERAKLVDAISRTDKQIIRLSILSGQKKG
jgi:DNA-binding NtrC family response regulator